MQRLARHNTESHKEAPDKVRVCAALYSRRCLRTSMAADRLAIGARAAASVAGVKAAEATIASSRHRQRSMVKQESAASRPARDCLAGRACVLRKPRRRLEGCLLFCTADGLREGYAAKNPCKTFI